MEVGYSVGDIPIEHLDYGYIKKCSSYSELEKILTILRSKSEGYYPDLIKFTEDKLRAVKPNSKLLFNDQKIKRTTELSHEEYKELKQDIDRWECIVNEKDAALSGMDDQFTDKGADLPPIRDPNSIDTASQDKVTSGSRGNPNPSRIKSTDFNKLDKFVTRESEEEETDKNRKSKSNPSPATVINDQLSDKGIEEELPLITNGTSNMDTIESVIVSDSVHNLCFCDQWKCPDKREMKLSNLEKEQQAIREKEKGNEAFRAGDYEEALGYYTRSISLFPTIAAHNNKAIVFIKLGRYDNAIVCCNRALEMEPSNVKGLMRRAESYQLLKQFKAAADDLQVVLKLEPDNKRAQQLLQKVEKDLPKQEKKGKRIAIQDVTEEEGNKRDSDIPINAAPAAQPCPQPLPSNIQKMKDEGNELFRAGQYGSAVTFYNRCIASLEKTSGDHAHSIATILSNRAACHLKNGDCRSCIDDASRSIELLPINLKSFIRRGQAYETLEKYKQAYNDYQVALRIDGRVDNIRNASSRISRLLREQFGNNWRDSLPLNQDMDRVTAALSSVVPPQSITSPPSSLPDTIPVITSTANVSQPVTRLSQSTTSTITSPSVSSNNTISSRGTTAPVTSTTTSGNYDELKDKGNTYVKKHEYGSACVCYTECISIQPTEVAPYTNRALCYLKLSEYLLAEGDCSKALELEPENGKALYRRALARKGLDKFNEGLKDIRQLMVLEPNNNTAKKEEKVIHDMYLKKLRELQATQEIETKTESKATSSGVSKNPNNVAKQQADQVTRKKVTIEEVSEEPQKIEEKVTEPEITMKTSSNEHKIIKLSEIKEEKLSISQYIQLWNSLPHTARPLDYAVLLMKIPSSVLSQVITNKLEGHTLTGIIFAIDQYILNEGYNQKAFEILESLTKVDRFSIVSMFLGDGDRNVLGKIFSSLHVTGIKPNDLLKLKQMYNIV